MRCPKCHRKLLADRQFCPYDGTPLVREFDDAVDEEAGTTVYRRPPDGQSSQGTRPVDRSAPTVIRSRPDHPASSGAEAARSPMPPPVSTATSTATLEEAASPSQAEVGESPWAPEEETEILHEPEGPPLPGPLSPGSRVGDYEISGVLGHGGMTTVYAGRHPAIGKQVAIKVLHGAYAGQGDHLERFLQEARVVNQVNSDRVVPVFAFGRLDDGRAYLVMDYVEGQSLEVLLRQGGALATTQAYSLFLDVASALAAAHAEGIVHRDVKPANIMVQLDAQSQFRARVVDFGVAKLLGPLGQGGVRTARGMMIGTPAYMAPEQIYGQSPDPRTDVYGFGVTLFQALTGELPFPMEDGVDVVVQHLKWVPRIPSSLRPGLSREWDELVLRCLEKDPQRRPQSMVEVRNRLARIGASPSRGGTGYRTAVARNGVSGSGLWGEDGSTEPVAPRQRAAASPRWSWWLLWGGLALLVTLALVLALLRLW